MFWLQTPGYREDDDAGYEVFLRYQDRVKTACLMRIGHEVKMRDAWAHAHENDLEIPERFVPTLAIDKMRTLDSLRGFLELQKMGRKIQDHGAPPILCAIATAVEESGTSSLPSLLMMCFWISCPACMYVRPCIAFH